MTEPLGKPSRDEIIGRNVANARGQRTQQAVAEAMRAAGHRWSQATVWSVEKGERPLRLAEAEMLASYLGIEVVDLLKLPRWYSFFDLQTALDRKYEVMLSAAGELDHYSYLLAQAADALVDEVGEDAVAAEMEAYDVGDTASRLIADAMAQQPVRRSVQLPGPYLRRYLDTRADRPSFGAHGEEGDDGEHQAEA